MATKNKKEEKKKRNRYIVIAAIGILFSVWLIIQKTAKPKYDFSPEVERIVSEANLTDNSKNILHEINVQLKGKAAFNGVCGKDNDPYGWVGGCYYPNNGSEYIDIFDSGREANSLEKALYDYEDSKVVTLAHEMMHAVYKRLSDVDREWIDIETNRIYARNTELKDELSKYPADKKSSELYARVSTEVFQIPDNLEKHFSIYFKDRIEIVNKYKKVQKQIQKALEYADVILEQIKEQEQEMKASRTVYQYYNALEERNRLVDIYNEQVQIYRKTMEKLDSEK